MGVVAGFVIRSSWHSLAHLLLQLKSLAKVTRKRTVEGAVAFHFAQSKPPPTPVDGAKVAVDVDTLVVVFKDQEELRLCVRAVRARGMTLRQEHGHSSQR